MKLITLLVLCLPLLGLASDQHASVDPEVQAAKDVLQLQKQYQDNLRASIRRRRTVCNPKNLLHRREWGSLSEPEREDYVNAVHCLANKTGQTSQTDIPGARTRYDDFVGCHLQQSPFVHADGLFLSYHRHFVRLYENALRTECGYQGAQSYWDWGLTYEDPRNATVFDGSPWSLGSNGLYVPDRDPVTINVFGQNLTFQPATGGGCVASGPFTPDKYVIHLGPIAGSPQGPQGGLGYNPRCLTRDLDPAFSRDTHPTNVSWELACADVACFNQLLDAPGGIHTSGHFQVGTITLDVLVSPSDPIFWLHHAQIDRLYPIWQGQDLRTRLNQVYGTVTTANIPPSENATLDTTISFGVLDSPKAIRDVLSTVDGDNCYIYE
ncbi:hypothetical protein B0T26DRAFT_700574 [Lasiosphaeria miniovina]|uniref:Tyrosinase copper-binding domain-containing protein n=1 Tax=Lasiosphaeria miniovina TaxID=1954250 RepID=A0AA40DZW7_9PEZI|nr:uncharacterized protein B0T26DRAFT_700574 [Lasiosphaeria miniovina]KAK0721880.1 hypothetical protein B0T26DRAFT_700574 [Lasiosphaeria miniovina]